MFKLNRESQYLYIHTWKQSFEYVNITFADFVIALTNVKTLKVEFGWRQKHHINLFFFVRSVILGVPVYYVGENLCSGWFLDAKLLMKNVSCLQVEAMLVSISRVFSSLISIWQRCFWNKIGVLFYVPQCISPLEIRVCLHLCSRRPTNHSERRERYVWPWEANQRSRLSWSAGRSTWQYYCRFESLLSINRKRVYILHVKYDFLLFKMSIVFSY